MIHNMYFQPKEAWEDICLLSKGEKIYHSSPRTIQMKLPSGELATMDEENEKVFSIHFGKVINDMRPTDYSVINEIQL